ncbi:DUF309 domain-containing protein [Dehalococcoidia bacterium]|nr:DUF309 domain-containing protein [Dehalococcoidia bacterium]
MTAISPKLTQAIKEFNQQDYFQAHDTLEVLWMPETGPTRPFYQGLIQIAVGLLHAQRGNRKGATSLLSQGLEKLSLFPTPCLGVDSTDLMTQIRSFLEELRALSAEDLGETLWDTPPTIMLIQQDHTLARKHGMGSP